MTAPFPSVLKISQDCLKLAKKSKQRLDFHNQPRNQNIDWNFINIQKIKAKIGINALCCTHPIASALPTDLQSTAPPAGSQSISAAAASSLLGSLARTPSKKIREAASLRFAPSHALSSSLRLQLSPTRSPLHSLPLNLPWLQREVKWPHQWRCGRWLLHPVGWTSLRAVSPETTLKQSWPHAKTCLIWPKACFAA